MHYKFFWVTFLTLILVGVKTYAAEPPKLIVFVVVDELDNNQLNFLQSEFSKNGFNGLANGGHRFMSLVSTDFSGYPGTRVTSLFTGTTPSRHGVIGERWMDYQKGEFNLAPSLDSLSLHKTIFYNQSRSLADYLKSYYGHKSLSVGFSLNAPWMIHSLGYSPHHFFTFDLSKGIFFDALQTDSTEYSWLKRFNSSISSTSLLKSQWGPVKDISNYLEYKNQRDAAEEFRTFFYTMRGKGNSLFERVASSPAGNTLLRDVVVTYLANSELGKDNIPDLLTICFTTKPFVETPSFWLPAEKEDMLLRLDENIASLVEFLDYQYGSENYLLALTSASSSAEEKQMVGKKTLNGGFVDQKKIGALLNLYLMALHGQGNWVLGVYDHQIFLNRQLISENSLLLKEVQEKSALFVMEMAGIARTIPTFEMMLTPPIDEPFKSNFFPMRAGDLFYTLKPGWEANQAESFGVQSSVSGAELVPFILKGWGVSPGVTIKRMNINSIVPNLLNQMNISISEFVRQWDDHSSQYDETSVGSAFKGE